MKNENEDLENLFQKLEHKWDIEEIKYKYFINKLAMEGKYYMHTLKRLVVICFILLIIFVCFLFSLNGES